MMNVRIYVQNNFMDRMFLISGILFIVTFLCHFSSPQNGLIGVNAEKGGKKIHLTNGDFMKIKKVVSPFSLFTYFRL